jgi:HemX protein
VLVVGVLIVPVVLMMFAAAFVVSKRAFALPGGGSPLMAAHIPLVFLSYTAFLYAAVSAALYLVQDARMKRKGPSACFERIPPLEWLERFTAGALVAGFVVLTIGLALGLAWLAAAGPAGGFQDPKIAATAVIWLLYAALVVVRLTAWGRGRRVALMAIACFVLALASYAFIKHWIPSAKARDGSASAQEGTRPSQEGTRTAPEGTRTAPEGTRP